METIKQIKTKVLELKCIITEMKNLMAILTSILGKEERVS